MMYITVEDLTNCGATLGLQQKACLLTYGTLMRELSFLKHLLLLFPIYKTYHRSKALQDLFRSSRAVLTQTC